jgi:hypothetical protein
MAFAPLEVSFDRGDASIVGCFNEKENDHLFEYSKNDSKEYPHKIWVTFPSEIDCGYRMGLVKKTVAYVVVDENEYGFVVEKWNIKNQRDYVR